MNTKEMERYKHLLLTRRNELTAARERSTTASPEREVKGDEGDQASAGVESALQIHLRAADSKLLQEIVRALARIGNGSFGTCEDCGQPISKSRLEALPWATVCRDCGEGKESK